MKWLANLLRSKTRQSESQETPKSRRRGRLPTVIDALWSRTNDSAIPATIRDLGLTGVRIEAAKGASTGATSTLRVSVGKHLEARDTQMFLTLPVVAVHSARSKDGRHYEIGLRFADGSHPARDRWIALVLQDAGFEIDPSQERDAKRLTPKTPIGVLARTKAGQAKGQLVNISDSGALAHLNGIEFAHGAEVSLQLGPWLDTSTIELSATVIRTRGEVTDGSYLMAVSFHLEAEQERALHQKLSLLATP
jgi:c-di-GMP-binding flagellar brake protein YcgR